MDEAALLVHTNYHVTYSLRRSDDVLEMCLWASPAVLSDQTDPPPRVCWLYALQQAAQLQQRKASLPRGAVPRTLEGHALPQQLDSDGGTKSTSPRRASKRQRTAAWEAAQQGTVLEGSSHTSMGNERHSLPAELPAAAAAGVHPCGQPAQPDSWASEPVLGMDFLELSDTLLAFALIRARPSGMYRVQVLDSAKACQTHLLHLVCRVRQCSNDLAAVAGIAAPAIPASPRQLYSFSLVPAGPPSGGATCREDV